VRFLLLLLMRSPRNSKIGVNDDVNFLITFTSVDVLSCQFYRTLLLLSFSFSCGPTQPVGPVVINNPFSFSGTFSEKDETVPFLGDSHCTGHMRTYVSTRATLKI
jgi:hypothetical protein